MEAQWALFLVLYGQEIVRVGNALAQKNDYTEEKANVVAALWETDFIDTPCRACYFAPGRLEEQDELYQDDMKYRMNCTLQYEEKDEFILFFNFSWCKIASAART